MRDHPVEGVVSVEERRGRSPSDAIGFSHDEHGRDRDAEADDEKSDDDDHRLSPHTSQFANPIAVPLSLMMRALHEQGPALAAAR